jgi:hypothetical protein
MGHSGDCKMSSFTAMASTWSQKRSSKREFILCSI